MLPPRGRLLASSPKDLAPLPPPPPERGRCPDAPLDRADLPPNPLRAELARPAARRGALAMVERGGLGLEDALDLLTGRMGRARAEATIERLGGPRRLSDFGPRVGTLFLLGLAERGAPPGLVAEAAERLPELVVLRPDGGLASIGTGAALGRLGAGHGLELGRLYDARGGVIRRVDGSLAPTGEPLTELPLGRDLASAALDGVERALLGTARGIVATALDPVGALSSLAEVPPKIAALVASRAELYDRFVSLPREDQVALAAELATSLVVFEASAHYVGATVARGGAGRAGLALSGGPTLAPALAVALDVEAAVAAAVAAGPGSLATLAALGRLEALEPTPLLRVSGKIDDLTSGEYAGYTVHYEDLRPKHFRCAAPIDEMVQALRRPRTKNQRAFAEAIERGDKSFGGQLSKEAIASYAALVRAALEHGVRDGAKIVHTAGFDVGIDVVTGRATRRFELSFTASERTLNAVHFYPIEP